MVTIKKIKKQHEKTDIKWYYKETEAKCDADSNIRMLLGWKKAKTLPTKLIRVWSISYLHYVLVFKDIESPPDETEFMF